MSDLSLVWHEYERSSQLSNQILGDVVLLKRTQFGLPGCDKVSEDELRRCHLRLASFVTATVQSLDADSDVKALKTWQPEESDEKDHRTALLEDVNPVVHSVPGPLLEHLREVNAGVMPRYIDNLIELSQELTKGQPLSPSQWELLEGLSGHVHQESSRLFRRLWRK